LYKSQIGFTTHHNIGGTRILLLGGKILSQFTDPFKMIRLPYQNFFWGGDHPPEMRKVYPVDDNTHWLPLFDR